MRERLRAWTERLETFFLEVIVEERRGVREGLVRGLLYACSKGFEAAIKARRFLYNVRILRDSTLGVQVIAVGNLTVGGTGKTPVVEKLARELDLHHEERRQHPRVGPPYRPTYPGGGHNRVHAAPAVSGGCVHGRAPRARVVERTEGGVLERHCAAGELRAKPGPARRGAGLFQAVCGSPSLYAAGD